MKYEEFEVKFLREKIWAMVYTIMVGCYLQASALGIFEEANGPGFGYPRKGSSHITPL